MKFLADGDLSGVGSVLEWSAVMLGIIIAAFFAYTQFKRWMKEPEPTVGAGFTLSDLRELHRQGKLTAEEFEATKSKIVAAAKSTPEPAPAMPRTKRQSKNMPAESSPDGGP